MSEIFNFVIFQVLDKAPIFLGLIALVGLLLQKKSGAEIIEEVVQTVLGIIILTIGSGILMSALSPIMGKLNLVLNIKGVLPANEAVFGVAMLEFASSITMTFLIGFVIHLFLVFFLPFKFCKNVYLTVHIQLFLSAFMVLSLPGVLGVKGIPLILIGAILCALYWTFTPGITRMVGRKFMGEDFTLGHNQQVGTLLASKVAPLFGSNKQDAENIKLPGLLSIFKNNSVSMFFLMPIIFLGVGIAIGSDGITQLSGNVHWVMWLILEGLKFTAGVVILLFGVKMFIESIITAFRGFSQRILPNSIPALDCPSVFTFSPTGALLGFIGSVVGALLVLAATIIFGSSIIVFPSPIIMFFDGSTMGVFGNKYGGYKGAIGAGFISSILAHTGVIFLYPMIGAAYGSGLMFSNIDFTLVWLPIMYLLKFIGSIFGMI